MSKILRAVCFFSLLFIQLFLLSLPVSADDDLALIWQNKTEAAAASFSERLVKNPLDARALLGLALVHAQYDAPLAELNDWSAYFRLAPESWQAQAFWPEMVSLADYTGNWEPLNDAARCIIAEKNVSPSLRASAQLVLAQDEVRSGKPADAAARIGKLGYLRKWMVIGPFENVSNSGFAKAYPPENEIDFQKSYRGINDQVEQWHRLQVVSSDGTCLLGKALGDEKASVYYAVTAIKSAKSQEALLCFNPTGASKVFLNGEQVYTDDIERVEPLFVADPFIIRVKLPAGLNTVQVKLASDEYSAAFQLRFTTLNGDALPLEVADPTLAKSGKPENPERQPIPRGGANIYINAIRTQPQSIETSLALGKMLWFFNDYQASADELRSAIEKYPNAALLHWALCDTLSEDDQFDEAKAEREIVRKLNNKIVGVELEYLEEQSESLTSDEYIKQLKKLHTSFPSSPSIYWSLSEAYDDAEMYSEGKSAASKAIKLAPGVDNIVRQGDIYFASLKTISTSHDLLETHISNLKSKGKIAEAIAACQKGLAIDTSWMDIREALAECYMQKKNYTEALKTYEYLRMQCPQNADYIVKVADTLLDLKRKKEAIALYAKALPINPGNVTLRKKIQVLTGEPSALDLAPATPTEAIIAKAKEIKGKTGESAIVLLDEARTIVYPDYSTETHCSVIIKIFDEASAKKYEYFPMSFGSSTSDETIERARVIKADGKVQEVPKYYYQIAFPSLAPGDIIVVSYRVSDYRPGALAKQFWTEWMFQYDDAPVLQSRFVLITPAAMTFQTATHGTVPQPSVKETKGWKVTEWKAADIPAQRDEPMSPAERDRISWLDISTVNSWNDIVQWYRDLSGPLCIPDAVISAKAAELTKGAPSEEDKIRALVAFVQGINYQSTPFRMSAYLPTKGKKVIREQYGDCKDKAALLTALLAAVDVKADMVLLSGRSDGITPYLPSPRFTHAITRVQTSGGPLWVDATADKMEFANLPLDDQGVPALIINDSTTDLQVSPLLPVEKNMDETKFDLVLSENGKLSGTLTTSISGNSAWMLRSLMGKIPESKYDQILSYMTGKLIPAANYDGGSIERLTEIGTPLVFKSQFHSDNYATNAGDFTLLHLPIGSISESFSLLQKTKKRKTDIETGDSRCKTIVITQIELPKGYTVQNIQQELSSASPWVSYKLTHTLQGITLTATLEITESALRLPANDVERYIEFLEGLKKETDKQLVLKKTQ